jgi:hypothetical protein
MRSVVVMMMVVVMVMMMVVVMVMMMVVMRQWVGCGGKDVPRTVGANCVDCCRGHQENRKSYYTAEYESPVRARSYDSLQVGFGFTI